ncbi:MAG TPA: type II secretion system F family protein [Dehalococcoidia bacterium]|nr:type II secretion system F family protein [Dehalococcoidia bacterium]
MVLLGAMFVFVAIVLLVLGLGWQTAHPMSARIASLRGEVPLVDFRATPESAKTRLLGPMVSSLGSTLEKILPSKWIQGIDHRLTQAGQPTTTKGFLVAYAMAIGVMSLFAFTVLTSGSFSGLLGMVIVLGCLALGIFLPKAWLDNRVRARQHAILKSLPDAFDLVTTCVEAGLGLEAALSRVAEKVEGPFGEELAVMLREVQMGKLRRDAMREMSDRTGVPDLTTFINAVVQAESMGTSIAAVLRVQAEQMRIKRRQRAEQQAQAAPIKMMFPLVLFIFPTLFIVILGPAAISIYQQLIAKPS